MVESTQAVWEAIYNQILIQASIRGEGPQMDVLASPIANGVYGSHPLITIISWHYMAHHVLPRTPLTQGATSWRSTNLIWTFDIYFFIDHQRDLIHGILTLDFWLTLRARQHVPITDIFIYSVEVMCNKVGVHMLSLSCALFM